MNTTVRASPTTLAQILQGLAKSIENVCARKPKRQRVDCESYANSYA